MDEVRQLLTSFEENLGKWLPLSKAGPVRICRRSPGAGRSLAHVGGQPAGGVLWRWQRPAEQRQLANSGLTANLECLQHTYCRLVHNDALDMIRVGFNLKGFEMTVNGYAEILDRCDGAVRG